MLLGCASEYLFPEANLHFLKDCMLEVFFPLVTKAHCYCHLEIYVVLVINNKARGEGGTTEHEVELFGKGYFF